MTTIKRPRLASISITEFPHEEEVLQYLLSQTNVIEALDQLRSGDIQQARALLMNQLSSEVSKRVDEISQEIQRREKNRQLLGNPSGQLNWTQSNHSLNVNDLFHQFQLVNSKLGLLAASKWFLEILTTSAPSMIASAEQMFMEIFQVVLVTNKNHADGIGLIVSIIYNFPGSYNTLTARLTGIQRVIPMFLGRLGEYIERNPKAPDFFIDLLVGIADADNGKQHDIGEQIEGLLMILGEDNEEVFMEIGRRSTNGAKAREWAVKELAKIKNISDDEARNGYF
jgi:hypothetical protein